MKSLSEPVSFGYKIGLARQLNHGNSTLFLVDFEANQALCGQSVTTFVSVGEATLAQQLFRPVYVSLSLGQHLHAVLQRRVSQLAELFHECCAGLERK
mgnify:CR=1 FL=1